LPKPFIALVTKIVVQSTPALMSNPSNSSKTVVKRVQYGALPYRLRAGSRQPQFMLITSRETRRWVIPKGWPKKGKSPQYSAAREAFEEAGVLGAVARRSVGSFSYEKRLKNGGLVVCDVRVFPLEVRRQSKQWPEKQERIVKWLSASQAAEKVDEPTLGEIIRRLAQTAQRPRPQRRHRSPR
jgi:8-oxo-dGTP pyrophosphatase MutT (NUDIX family)